jgi:hypothetical protein
VARARKCQGCANDHHCFQSAFLERSSPSTSTHASFKAASIAFLLPEPRASTFPNSFASLQAAAAAGAAAVAVTYGPAEPPILSIDAARERGSYYAMRPPFGDIEKSDGDVAGALAAAPLSIRGGRIWLPGTYHMYMEPQVGCARGGEHACAGVYAAGGVAPIYWRCWCMRVRARLIRRWRDGAQPFSMCRICAVCCVQNALAVPDEGGAIKVHSSCQVCAAWGGWAWVPYAGIPGCLLCICARAPGSMLQSDECPFAA